MLKKNNHGDGGRDKVDYYNFSGLNEWIVVFGVEHEEYLEAVDLTSYVGTIPTWLASYFLV